MASSSLTSDLYTPFTSALEELRNRQSDMGLQQKIRDFLGDELTLLEPITMRPRAVLSRYIASPNLEMEYFIDATRNVGLDPLVLEYTADKLVARNLEKYHLGKLFFYDRDQMGHVYLKTTAKIIDFNASEGKSISDIPTSANDSLPEFHHKLLQNYFKLASPDVYDFSDWFKKSRLSNDPGEYYAKYLSLFLQNAILFENFLLGKGESDFTMNKVIPSFKAVTDHFGIKPLIVPITPQEHDEEVFWCYYNINILTFIRDHGL